MTWNPLRWLGALAKWLGVLVSHSGAAATHIEQIVLPVIKQVGALDVVNDRGKLADTINAILTTLKLPWLEDAGIAFTDLMTMNKHDFRLWLACAQSALAIANKLGAVNIPALDLLRGIVGALYSVSKRGPT